MNTNIVKPYFCIIGRGDIPIFETHFSNTQKYGISGDEISAFTIQSTLDVLDQKIVSSNSLYLKNIDKFGDMCISAYVTAGHAKLLLLHSPRLDDNALKSFFAGVHELYVKAIMNPFSQIHAALNSPNFEKYVVQLGTKYV